MNLRIAVLKIDELLLHEETIPELVEHLAWSIKKAGCLKHPIIVDAKTRLVLDGVHRVAALKKLGCKYIPVCLVDYMNPAIRVLSWHRTISGVNNLETLLSEVRKVAGQVKRVAQIDENLIGKSPVAATLRTVNQNFLLNNPFESLSEAYGIIKRVEQRLKKLGFKIAYETESDAHQRLKKRQADAVLCTPRLSKQSIIEAARSGKLFAHKATRHVIPARPLNICVPLRLLRGDKPLRKLNQMLKDMLAVKKMKHLSSGSVFEGRRYEEDLYVFEE